MSAKPWNATLASPVSPIRDHIRGFVDAPVTLLEYGDYECPYCAIAHVTVSAIRTHMGSNLRFVYRHFPLTAMHPHARDAAKAAEAAGGQEKFWEMHDLLFENQQQLQLSAVYFLACAKNLQLDIDQFRQDLIEHTYGPKVQHDFMSGVKSAVNGTPTFYINGIRYDGSWDFSKLFPTLQRMASMCVPA